MVEKFRDIAFEWSPTAEVLSDFLSVAPQSRFGRCTVESYNGPSGNGPSVWGSV